MKNHKNLKGFTLIELLVVIAIIASLMAILMPSLSRARTQAKILVVNRELYQIGLALDAYEIDNGTWPPVHTDCMLGSSVYTLPSELVKMGYITGGQNGSVVFSDIEDNFCKGYTYRYMAVEKGVTIKGKAMPFDISLCMPKNLPNGSDEDLQWYEKRKDCPVKWAVFSLGPNYDIQKMEKEIKSGDWRGFPISSGFPFIKDTWYKPQTGIGLLTRIKTSKDQYIGTFQKQ